jgi:hypothetical protein
MPVLASTFPVQDWQFWVATAIFVLAAGFLVRKSLPIPWLQRRRHRRARQRRVTLTIDRDRPRA